MGAAYYFYLQSVQERVPTLLLDSGVTVIVFSNESSDIAISYKGQTIKQRNVLAVRLYFWNHGNLPIRRGDVLTPIQCKIDPNDDILETRLLKVSREVTHLQIHKDEAELHKIDIEFEILEQNDGGAIQLIYAGNLDPKISCQGTIVGASTINLTKSSELKEAMNSKRSIWKWVFCAAIGMALSVALIWKRNQMRTFVQSFVGLMLICFMTGFMVAEIGTLITLIVFSDPEAVQQVPQEIVPQSGAGI